MCNTVSSMLDPEEQVAVVSSQSISPWHLPGISLQFPCYLLVISWLSLGYLPPNTVTPLPPRTTAFSTPGIFGYLLFSPALTLGVLWFLSSSYLLVILLANALAAPPFGGLFTKVVPMMTEITHHTLTNGFLWCYLLASGYPQVVMWPVIL